jgi:hypothetical protein
MVTWVIQTNFLDRDQVDAIAWAARNDGAQVVEAKVIPFSDEIQLSEPVNLTDVIPYGSTKLSKLAYAGNWSGLFFNDNFNTVTWNKNRSDMLNQKAYVMAVKDLANFLKVDHEDSVFFIRPIEDLKAFNGTVTDVKEIRNWMNSTESGNFSFSEDTLVSIAPPQHISGEWRWFIVDGKIIDGSMYKIKGQRLTKHEKDAAIIAEAQKLADVWLPHQTCVMDTALTEFGVKVIEFNCMNSSGLYCNDIQKIVSAITNSARSYI